MKSKYEENLIQLSDGSVEKMQKYIVTKPNEFVKNVPYPRLTVIQNRIFCFMIALVEPSDDKFKEVNFNTKLFSQIFGMHSRSSTVIKKAILGLRGNPVFAEINPEVKGSVALTWCHVYIEEETGIIRLRLDEELGRFFLHVDPKKGFIRYPLYEIMNLNCKYSFWFYDQFKLGMTIGKRNLPLDYIKKQLSLPSSYDAKYIKKKIINPVMDDLNEHTDLDIKYSTVKRGNRVEGYHFTFKYKNRNEQIEQKSKNMFYVSTEDKRYEDILLYLNLKTKQNYNLSDENYKALINRWLSEGYNTIDFFLVIDNKVKSWMDTEYEEYLCPETLFGDKFLKYLYNK